MPSEPWSALQKSSTPLTSRGTPSSGILWKFQLETLHVSFNFCTSHSLISVIAHFDVFKSSTGISMHWNLVQTCARGRATNLKKFFNFFYESLRRSSVISEAELNGFPVLVFKHDV